MISYHSSLVSTCKHAMVRPCVSLTADTRANEKRMSALQSLQQLRHLEHQQEVLCKVVESLIAILWILQVCSTYLPRVSRTQESLHVDAHQAFWP
jgi:hypothetical protein